MSNQDSTIHERLLYRVVRKKVEEAINPLFKDLGELAKEFGMEATGAKLIGLEMIRASMEEICYVQKTRIELGETRTAKLRDFRQWDKPE